ncbi:protein kinase domain protein [Ichthyophthirius multifiliis]|uniref:Protein kinase domain protein n=1 Tax=Ichthyophthirius multifiliis TaxID=5932 RepID=G0R118_ICHMU|nr:protein kinase domain protein [Ichthyophthirius multifiliis]EGR28785.1 protein kinase domain protein [Ichthyophthirius multifiliis]|eukprot:XP_004030021.1 protein kinase domain protein [Ichthyophthirius multifiliis]
MEYSINGELYYYISQQSYLFDEDLARFYFSQILNVLEFLHSSGYCHRDIKPENILLDEFFNIKLVDFGMSCNQENYNEKNLNYFVGTKSYAAPEIIHKIPYNGFKVDIFALGVILFCMVSGFPPYYQKAAINDPYYKYFAENEKDLYWNVIQAKFNKCYSIEFICLINGMLEFNPDERFSLQDIFNDQWLQKGNLISKDEVIRRMQIIKQNINFQGDF